MITVLLMDVAVTAVLGVLLLFAWLQDRRTRSLCHWANAHMILTAALVTLVWGGLSGNFWLLDLGLGGIILSYALMWGAARLFDREGIPLLGIAAGPAVWFVASFGGYVAPLEAKIILVGPILSFYCLAAAREYYRGRTERLMSRWPAVVLLGIMSAGFLSWVVMAMFRPYPEAQTLDTVVWFPLVIMATVLGRMAMAFIVLAMAKERLELRQRTQALTDPLTGLPNRRAFFRSAARRLRQRHMFPQPVSVLLFDLDHFKEINDRHGHAVGDRMLAIFAETLMERLQASDILGRVGGEEFAAVLPATRIADAVQAAERVRAAYADRTAAPGNAPIANTVSIGVAGSNTDDCSLHELLSRADSALYTAKKRGRNRVELAADGPPSTPRSGARMSPTQAPDTVPALQVEFDLGGARNR